MRSAQGLRSDHVWHSRIKRGVEDADCFPEFSFCMIFPNTGDDNNPWTQPERTHIQVLTLQLSFDNIKSLNEICKETKAKVMSEILAWKELLNDVGAPWNLKYVLEAHNDDP